jgi:hypothetical protein
MGYNTKRFNHSVRSNLQQAQQARALELLRDPDIFKRYTGGVNSKLTDALHGDFDPRHFLSYEKPWHRTAINMSAAGYRNNEIAAAVERSPQSVATALKQPWAREYLINQAKKTVQDEIKAVLEAEAMPSIRMLVSVRDGATTKNADRLAASNALLDRFLGKPVQPMTTDAKPVDTMSDAELKAQVERELAASKAN